MFSTRKFRISILLASLCLCASGSNGAAQTYPISNPGTTFTTLHSFDGTDGRLSFAGLVQATNGNLYGTTYYGGAKNSGEVFEITPGGTATTLHSFCSKRGCTDGEYTYATPVQGTDGNFYGTTYLGGSKELGTVFKVTPSGTATTLHTFGGPDGSQPLAGLVQARNGDFYGTTSIGGSQGQGAVFKITPNGALTTLHSFCSQSGCTNGENPFAGLILGVDGNLYGTTFGGARPRALGRSSKSLQAARSPRCTGFAGKAVALTASTREEGWFKPQMEICMGQRTMAGPTATARSSACL